MSRKARTVTPSTADNVERIKGLYEAFGRGEVATVLEAMDDKIEWNEAEGNPYDPGHPFIGPSEVVENVFARILSDTDGFEIHPERFVGEANTVVMLSRYRAATAHATGKALNAQAVHVWDLKDGKIVRFQQYMDTRQMARVLGVTET